MPGAYSAYGAHLSKDQTPFGCASQRSAYDWWMLEIQRLLTFDAVVRTGTFAAAARELGYTQPGVSQQMRALERDLRCSLFVRAGRALRLSDEGHALAARVPTLLAEVRATEERVASVARLRNGRVRVCAFPSANATLVPAAISELRSRNLGIEIELFEAEPPESISGLRAGDYDIVVSFSYDNEGEDDELGNGGQTTPSAELHSVAIMHEPLMLLLPDQHPLARRHHVDLADLHDERWVAGCVRCRQSFVAACSESGFAPRIDITTDDNLAVQSYVVSGLGLSVMPEMVQSFVRHPRLAIRPLRPERFRTITVITQVAADGVHAVEQMISSLRSAAKNIQQTSRNQ